MVCTKILSMSAIFHAYIFMQLRKNTQNNYYHVFIMLTCNNFLSLNACVGVRNTHRQKRTYLENL